jgi:Uma2 family endonuclease
VLAQEDVAPERIRPLRRVEYEALVEQGMLADARVELLCGALVEMTPQGPAHADVVARLAAALTRGLPSGVIVRSHSPLALLDDSEPEPDIAVVPGGDYRSAHPSRALLVIEVADSSLRKDRGIKAALYARAAIPEVWVFDLVAQVAEVHRHPSGDRYREITPIDVGGELTAAAFPDLRIRVADLLA